MIRDIDEQTDSIEVYLQLIPQPSPMEPNHVHDSQTVEDSITTPNSLILEATLARRQRCVQLRKLQDRRERLANLYSDIMVGLAEAQKLEYDSGDVNA
jgi:hypothetical protein